MKSLLIATSLGLLATAAVAETDYDVHTTVTDQGAFSANYAYVVQWSDSPDAIQNAIVIQDAKYVDIHFDGNVTKVGDVTFMAPVVSSEFADLLGYCAIGDCAIDE